MKLLAIIIVVLLYLVQNSKSFNFSTVPIKMNQTTIHLQQTNETLKRAYYSKLGKQISLIISPILLVIGGIGNPLCIAVLIRKRKSNPTIVYLCLLAAIDFLVLFTGLLRKYLKESMNIDLRGYSTLNCKFHIFFTYTFMQISSYILVAVTVNRFTIMFSRTIFCRQKQVTRLKKESNKSVIWIFLTICFVVSLLNSHFLIFYELIGSAAKQRKNQEDCSIDKSRHASYYYFRDKIFTQIHLHLFIVFPCIILFIMNILIIRKLMENKSSLTQGRPSKQNRKKEKKRTALSIMLVSVCLWFVLLKTPASVTINFPEWMDKPEYMLVYSIVMLINYTNHAVNLILYIVISSQFRKEFKAFFIEIKNKFPCFKTKNNSQQQPKENEKKSGIIPEKVNLIKIDESKIKDKTSQIPDEVVV